MNHLLRSYAPISDESWAELDREVQARLLPGLAARRLVDFNGPHGWEHSAVDLGRVTGIDGPAPDLEAAQRRVLPLAELRAGFTVSRAELRDLDRGAVDLDLSSVDAASRRIAEAENVAVFHGWKSAGIAGISEVSGTPSISAGSSFADFPKHVAKAVEILLSAGVSGPYGLALGPDGYTGVVETTENGGLNSYSSSLRTYRRMSIAVRITGRWAVGGRWPHSFFTACTISCAMSGSSARCVPAEVRLIAPRTASSICGSSRYTTSVFVPRAYLCET